jgi:hypothetical protein
MIDLQNCINLFPKARLLGTFSGSSASVLMTDIQTENLGILASGSTTSTGQPDFRMAVSADNGSTFADQWNYRVQRILIDGTLSNVSTPGSTTDAAIVRMLATTSPVQRPMSAWVTVRNFSEAKPSVYFGLWTGRETEQRFGFTRGLSQESVAYNAIRFTMDTGTFNGFIRVYDLSRPLP